MVDLVEVYAAKLLNVSIINYFDFSKAAEVVTQVVVVVDIQEAIR